MARPIWEGEISFGLINIGVELHNAVRKTSINLDMIDSRDKAKIRYLKVNEETGEEVAWNEIAKGFEYEDGHYVLLDPEELEEIKPSLTKTIELEEFVEFDQIPPLLFEKPYYLVPNERSAKSYILLHQVLTQKNKVGIGKVVIRTKEYLGAVMPYENALILTLMLFPQEVRPIADFDIPETSGKAAAKIKSKEIELSSQLIDSMTADWDPSKYHDEYREALDQWIEEKVAAEKRGAKPRRKRVKKAETRKSNVINIEALLKKSLEANKKRPTKSVKRASKTATREKRV